jgi:hypothetical protein
MVRTLLRVVAYSALGVLAFLLLAALINIIFGA